MLSLAACSLKAQDLELVLPLGHQDDISTMSLSHNEQFLITGSSDKTLKLWDVRSGLLIQTYYGHTTGVKQAIFSLNDKILISGAADGQIIIWDLETADIIEMFPGASSEVESISLSSDGSMVCFSFQTGKIEIRSTTDWSKVSEREEKLLKGEAVLLDDNVSLIYNGYNQIKKWNIHKSETWALSKSTNSYYVEKDADILSVDNQDMRIIDLQVNGNRVLHRSVDEKRQWIVMRDTQALKVLFEIKLSTEKNAQLMFCNKGQEFCLISQVANSWQLDFFSAANGKALRTESISNELLKGDLISFQIAKDNRNVFLASDESVIRVDLAFQANNTAYTGAAMEIGQASYNAESNSIRLLENIWQLNSFSNPLTTATETFDSKDIQDYFADLDLGIPTVVAISPNKKLVAAGFSNKSIKIFNRENKSMLKRLWGHADVISQLEFSTDNQYLISSAGALDRKIIVWDLSNYKTLGKYSGHSASALSISTIPGKTIVMTSSEDRSIQFWDYKSMETVLTLVRLGAEDWAIIHPDRYYACSPAAALKISYRQGLKVYPFDQFDMIYNRPDLVLQSLSLISGDDKSTLQARYKLAWEKRLRKLGLHPEEVSQLLAVPECELLSELPIRTTENSIRLSLDAKDQQYPLLKLHVWINGVALYGSQGIYIRGNRQQFDSSFSVYLSSGLNKIEYSVVNSIGSESLHSPVFIFHEHQKEVSSTTYFVGFGIDEFEDSSYNLNYSVKDIKDLASGLKQRTNQKLIIDTFFNQSLTMENVLAIKAKLMNTTIHDKVIICYSGHGLLNSSMDYFLSTYAVDFNAPDSGGVPYSLLEDLLDGIPARQKLMLIDACHSGEVDKDEKLRIQRISSEAGVEGQLASKGVFVEEEGSADGLDYESAFELMQQMFAAIQKGSGATIISAAAGDQFALEGGGLKNGFFTYAILNYMESHNEVSISELKSFVNAEVLRLSNGLQQPTSRLENYSIDWNLY